MVIKNGITPVIIKTQTHSVCPTRSGYSAPQRGHYGRTKLQHSGNRPQAAIKNGSRPAEAVRPAVVAQYFCHLNENFIP